MPSHVTVSPPADTSAALRGLVGMVVLAFFCLLCQPILADSITARMADNSIQKMDQVSIEGIGRDPATGIVNAYIKVPDGNVYPVPLHNVMEMSFGTAGEGRRFNLILTDGSRVETFNDSLILRFIQAEGYAKGGLVAREPEGGSPDEFFVSADTIEGLVPAALASAGTAAPSGAAAGAEGGGEPSDGVFTADPFNEGSPGDSAASSGEGTGSDSNYLTSGLDEEDDYSSLSSGGSSDVDQNIVIIVNIVFYTYAAMVWISTIWLILYAFSTGDNNSGFVLILALVCCNLLQIYKYMYAFNYKGSLRGLLLTIVIIEICVLLGLIILAVVAFAAVMALVSQFG